IQWTATNGQTTATVVDLNGDGQQDVATTGDGPSLLITSFSERRHSVIDLDFTPGLPRYRQPITITATARDPESEPPNPTGTVTFFDTTSDPPRTLGVATLDQNGVGELTTSSLGVFTHDITVDYSGDGTYSPSRAFRDITVNKAHTVTTLSASVSASTFGQPVAFITTVIPEFGGVPGGAVDLLESGQRVGSIALDGGEGTLALTPPIGSLSFFGSYSGDNNFLSSSSNAVALHVDKAPAIVHFSLPTDPVATGETVIFTVTVSDTVDVEPSGTITFNVVDPKGKESKKLAGVASTIPAGFSDVFRQPGRYTRPVIFLGNYKLRGGSPPGSRVGERNP